MFKIRENNRKVICVIVFLCVISIFAACQATPKELVVVGKGEEQIQEMIDSAQQSSENTDIVNYELIPNNYEAPEKMECVVTSNFEGCAEMEIRVDAPIIIPEYTLPMYKIVYTDIPYENLSAAIYMLTEGEALYRREYASRITIKSDIQSQIDYYNYELEHETGDSTEFYKNQIKKLLQEYENAPATYEEANIQPDDPEDMYEIFIDEDGNEIKEKITNPPNCLTEDEIGVFELNESTYLETQSLIVGQGMKTAPIFRFTGTKPEELLTSRYNYPMIMYKKNTGTDGQSINFISTLDRAIEDKDVPITLDEAIKRAEEIAVVLDDELEIVDIAPADQTVHIGDERTKIGYGYTIYFSKIYNGIEMNYAHGFSYYSKMRQQQNDDTMRNSALYSVPYPPEMLEITVGPDGIYELIYQSPAEIIEKISDNVELLPFAEVEVKFKEYIKYNGYDSGKVYMDITRIELSLMAIDQPDTDEYLVVPVWDFYGGAVLSSDTSIRTEEQYWNEEIHYHYGRSFLTINAVNGSIIDRGEGY